MTGEQRDGATLMLKAVSKRAGAEESVHPRYDNLNGPLSVRRQMVWDRF
jgi:hypothetical protein